MSTRTERADAEIQKAISEILLRDMNDPRFSTLITVTGVKTSPDFRFSKVFVSVLAKDEKEREDMLLLLKKSASYIRTMLCKMVRLPNAPFLSFELDEGEIYDQRISEILDKLNIPPAED